MHRTGSEDPHRREQNMFSVSFKWQSEPTHTALAHY